MRNFAKNYTMLMIGLDSYLSSKYHITKEDYPSEYYPGKVYEDCILPKEMIDEFINRASIIDLDKYTKKIGKYQSNIKL